RSCVRRGLISADPALGLPAPRRPRRLPRTLPLKELERALDRIAGADPVARRDRALLELAYSSGLRLAELVGLNGGDLDWEARLLRVRGKGGHQRVVPFGAAAGEALERWSDLRAIQEMLGHRSLASTQIYTHVSNRRLRQAYERAHPRA